MQHIIGLLFISILLLSTTTSFGEYQVQKGDRVQIDIWGNCHYQEIVYVDDCMNDILSKHYICFKGKSIREIKTAVIESAKRNYIIIEDNINITVCLKDSYYERCY